MKAFTTSAACETVSKHVYALYSMRVVASQAVLMTPNALAMASRDARCVPSASLAFFSCLFSDDTEDDPLDGLSANLALWKKLLDSPLPAVEELDSPFAPLLMRTLLAFSDLEGV